MSNENNHSINLNDFVLHTYGYGEIIADFYQVVRTTKTQVVLRQVAQDYNLLNGTTSPIAGDYITTKEVRKTVAVGGSYNMESIYFSKGMAAKWVGNPVVFGKVV